MGFWSEPSEESEGTSHVDRLEAVRAPFSLPVQHPLASVGGSIYAHRRQAVALVRLDVTRGWAGKELLRRASQFIDDRLVSEREDLFAYYAGQEEGQRLFRFPHNRLELLRRRELLLRQLPSPPAVVLDVGGGTGV